MVKAQKYDGNTHNAKGKTNTGTKTLIGTVAGIFILIAIGVGVLLYFSSKPAEYSLENGILIISGMYGEEVPVYEINKA